MLTHCSTDSASIVLVGTWWHSTINYNKERVKFIAYLIVAVPFIHLCWKFERAKFVQSSWSDIAQFSSPIILLLNIIVARLCNGTRVTAKNLSAKRQFMRIISSQTKKKIPRTAQYFLNQKNYFQWTPALNQRN